ncbi:transcription termination factor NusA [Helicobacter pylori]|nr:transcription termination factor NusA [Helicobacter pylori]
MEKISDLIECIAYEKNLPKEMISKVIQGCLLKMAQNELDPLARYLVVEENKQLQLIQLVEVLEDDDERLINDPSKYISLSKAKEMDPSVKIKDELSYSLSLESMKQGAINRLFKDLQYQLEKALEDSHFEAFQKRLNSVLMGQVILVDHNQNTFIEIEQQFQGVLSMRHRIKGESFKIGDSIKAVLTQIKRTKKGLLLELSRTTPKMLEALLELEVPEIKDKEIEIIHCARIPGNRAKVSFFSHNARIDPIGAAVGVKGVRINAISNELNKENIDCIEYSNVPEIYITLALAPAKILSVEIKKIPIEELSAEEKESVQERFIVNNHLQKAKVRLLDVEKSKAIGKGGVNVCLASMLTGYHIEFETIPSVKENAENESEKETPKVGVEALESLFKN